MRRPGLVVAGTIVALAGLVFFLQGVGVLKGSSMTNSTFWAAAGPVIVLVGLVTVALGRRGSAR